MAEVDHVKTSMEELEAILEHRARERLTTSPFDLWKLKNEARTVDALESIAESLVSIQGSTTLLASGLSEPGAPEAPE